MSGSLSKAGVFSAALLLTVACSSEGGEVRRTFYADGTPWSEIRFEANVPEGTWTTWYENGRKKSEGKYLRGSMHGPWSYWNEDGTLVLRAEYREDHTTGSWESFWDDGRPKQKGTFARSVRVSEWTEWFETGPMSSQGTYVDGEREGAWKMWFPTGQLAAEVQLRAGRTHGHQVIRMESGIVRVGEAIDGQEDGLWTFWYPGYPETKVKAGEAHMKLGAYHGRHVQYAEDGTVLSEGEWSEGSKTGRWVVRTPDGVVNPNESGLFENGVRVAPLPE